MLLFARGRRPDLDSIANALTQSRVGRVSFSPDDTSFAGGEIRWAELLAHGLTFDCIGLAPGEPLQADAPRHWRGIEEARLQDCEAIGLAPGPHLAGAGHLPPVVKTQLGLGASLLELCPDSLGALWRPSAIAIARTPFVQMIGQWTAGGPFPAPALIATHTTADGGVASEGLAYFTGEEVRITPSLASDPITARRLLFRLADRLFESAPPPPTGTIRLEDGTTVFVERRGGELVMSPA